MTEESTAYSLDSAERKRLEELAREGEERYRGLMELSPDAILINRNNRFTLANPAALRLFGASSADQLLGKSPYDLFHPDYHEIIRARLGRLQEGEQAALIEEKIVRLDGTAVDVEVAASPFTDREGRGIQVFLRDISQRKRSEESLRELSQAMEQSPVNVVITDREGNIEYVNRRFIQVTGYTSAEVLGKNPRILKSGHTSDEEYRALWQTITAGGDWCGEFLNKAKDGSLFWERALITSIKDEAGRIAHFLALKEDITEHKQAEEERHQMHLQLAHVARLSTLGEMAAELAHELNHPLYAILNYAKAVRNVLAEEGPPDLESVREWNEEIADIALSAAAVVKRLRSFARRGESPRTACRIEEVVEEALGLVAVETRRYHVTVETSFSAALPPLRADRVQIQQVFVNLLTNAMEAMQTVPKKQRRIAIRTLPGERSIEVVVSDCGVGLPPGSETKIFEPYVTTKPQGLGMGLSIVRTIVEAHGGRLWAAVNPEGGAAFHFTLPLENGAHPNGV